MCFLHVSKRSSNRSGSRMPSGNEFHTGGLDTGRLLSPKRRIWVRSTVRLRRNQLSFWALTLTSDTGMQVTLGAFWTATVDGMAHDDRNLEIDTPPNGKPVGVIPHHMSDAIEFSCVGLLNPYLPEVGYNIPQACLVAKWSQLPKFKKSVMPHD